ncbi:hypothetical protein OEZ86_009817 [Tetradesmus obliquus]|nr:hypothetical protein OEZ86_009817 [Tetradesmus obliquus]
MRMKSLSPTNTLASRPRCRAAVVSCCNNHHQQQQQQQQQQQAQPCPAPIPFQTRAGVYRSAAQINPIKHNCTLCSQLSLDRWPRWAQQAASWGGPLSVAVYIPAPYGSAAAEAGIQLACQLAEKYVRSHPQQPLQVSVLFAQQYAREGAAALQQAGVTAAEHPLLDPTASYLPSYDQLYPINALRNLALSQAATPLVLCADGDFIFGEGLQEMLLQPWALQLLQPDIQQQQQQQQQQPVMLGVAVKGQLPLYDEAFRGYGLNKVQHAWHCAQLGYSFQVLSDAFMVTAPHKRSSSWRPVPGTATDDAHLAMISQVYEQFKQRLAAELAMSCEK